MPLTPGKFWLLHAGENVPEKAKLDLKESGGRSGRRD